MIAGIVCEYNPFHNGHLYHINRTRELGADYIVAVMSGNFVQRGECAAIDKWLRGKAAILSGADLVIDLPTPWSMASAETFARGSVGLLMNFGIDYLSFGCESDNKDLLIKCAEALYDERVSDILKKEAAKGLTYPAAVSKAVGEVYGEEYQKALKTPNNTLAIEYIKQLRRYNKQDNILPIKREGVLHDSSATKGNIASASKIRGDKFSEWQSFMPKEAYALFKDANNKGYAPCSLTYSERGIISCLRKTKKEDYDLYVSDESGLASRLYEAVQEAISLEDLYDKAKSKNYTMSRVRREVMNVYLGIEKNLSQGIPPYIKIIAANEKGLSLLSSAKKNTALPIITKHCEAQKLTGKAKEIYDLECRSTDLFSLMSEKIRACHLEETHSIIVVK